MQSPLKATKTDFQSVWRVDFNTIYHASCKSPAQEDQMQLLPLYLTESYNHFPAQISPALDIYISVVIC